MPDGSIPLLVAILVLLVLSALLSAIEMAYSSVNKIKLKNLANNGKRKANSVLKMLDKYDKLISVVLVGNNIVNIAAASIATVFFAKVLEGQAVDSTTISTIVLTVAVLLFCEITPKYIAKVYPERACMVLFPLTIFFYYLIKPIAFIFDVYKLILCKIFRIKADDTITEEEIMTIVEEAEEDGTFREDETNLIRSAIEFDDLEVGDILVPRVNISAINVNSSLEKLRALFEKDGYSRVPVFRDTIDTIIGVVHEKDFFNAYLSGEKKIESILQPAVYTTEHMKISSLLRQLQAKKLHMAVVLDEYGGTLGIVTLEDILEELVGEIWDEHDEEIKFFKNVDENTYIVDGKAPLDELFELFEIEKEIDNFEALTVSGWAIETLGEIPNVGKSFEFKSLTIEITKATIRRILEVKVTKQTIETEEK